MRKTALIVPYDYKLLSVAAILDVFETVNRLYAERGEEAPYQLHIYQQPEQIHAGRSAFHGYDILSPEDKQQMDLVLIPAFSTEDMRQTLERNRVWVPWLQRQFEGGAETGSFCTGAFLFAASGLLNKRAATTHVDASDAFGRLYPEVVLQSEHTVTADGRAYTSGGSTSTFHLLLLLVQKHCGADTAIRIAKIFAIDMDRYKQSYFSTFRPDYTHNDELVKDVQKKIENAYREADTIEEIIKDIPASRRNIVRRFTQATGIPPIEYLQHVRIESAKRLLEGTNQSITEVIDNTGYSDPKSFRKTFRRIVGMAPQEYKEKFRVK